MTFLPQWVKIIIRIILLPTAMIIHLIPHIVAYIRNMCFWVAYGGEFIIHSKEDKATISRIYYKLKEHDITQSKKGIE